MQSLLRPKFNLLTLPCSFSRIKALQRHLAPNSNLLVQEHCWKHMHQSVERVITAISPRVMKRTVCIHTGYILISGEGSPIDFGFFLRTPPLPQACVDTHTCFCSVVVCEFVIKIFLSFARLSSLPNGQRFIVVSMWDTQASADVSLLQAHLLRD